MPVYQRVKQVYLGLSVSAYVLLSLGAGVAVNGGLATSVAAHADHKPVITPPGPVAMSE